MLFTGPIDANKIVGAICIYLLTGLIWALFYLLIAQAIPGAFNGLQQLPWYQNFADVSYYSYVTLTTLGYGDISPVAPIARFLVYMEAIVGVFYMAILVASLIGIRTSEIQARGTDRVVAFRPCKWTGRLYASADTVIIVVPARRQPGLTA